MLLHAYMQYKQVISSAHAKVLSHPPLNYLWVKRAEEGLFSLLMSSASIPPSPCQWWFFFALDSDFTKHGPSGFMEESEHIQLQRSWDFCILIKHNENDFFPACFGDSLENLKWLLGFVRVLEFYMFLDLPVGICSSHSTLMMLIIARRSQ